MDWSHTLDIDGATLICRPLTWSRFPHLDLVMGEKAVTQKCFCMHWRRPDGGYRDERDNRARFAERVGQDRPPGLLGYIEDEPVGWVQVGPRQEFPTVYRSRLLKPADEVEAWTVNCFVVRSEFRRRGVGQGLRLSHRFRRLARGVGGGGIPGRRGADLGGRLLHRHHGHVHPARIRGDRAS